MKQEQDSVKKHIQRSEQRSKKEIYDTKMKIQLEGSEVKNLGKSKKKDKKTKGRKMRKLADPLKVIGIPKRANRK